MYETLNYDVGILVDKDDLIKYQLLISYGLLVRIFTYLDKVWIVGKDFYLSTTG